MFSKEIKTFSLISSILLAISACSQNISVSSNIDPDNFRNYFSASKIKIVSDETELTTPYKFIGLVEGTACQEKAHYQVPDEVEARTDARKQAYNLHANAVIFTACTLISNNEANKQCVATRVCYAKAYITQPQP
ncbi:Rcs stress response system protein RcsF [Thalassotalea piscium]